MLTARPATIKDKAQLLVWANDKEVRKQSFITKKIKKKEHDKWLSGILADKNNQKLFILENHFASPVGQVRFSRTDTDNWVVHFSMDPKYRGQKFGEHLIRVGLNAFLGQEHGSRITANVKNDNAASLRILAKAGFQIKEKYKPNDSEIQLVYISK